MKRVFDKKILLGIIIGGLIFGTIGVGASILYNSEQVSYKTTDNTDTDVNNALNELYDMQANATGVPSNVAKDVNGNAATTNYYGPRLSGVTRQFTMPKGKYLLNIYSTFTQSYYGGDSSSSASVSGANITKINNYCYVVEVTADTATISISFNSGGYGNSEDSRTMYAITFLQ